MPLLRAAVSLRGKKRAPLPISFTWIEQMNLLRHKSEIGQKGPNSNDDTDELLDTATNWCNYKEIVFCFPFFIMSELLNCNVNLHCKH